MVYIEGNSSFTVTLAERPMFSGILYRAGQDPRNAEIDRGDNTIEREKRFFFFKTSNNKQQNDCDY